MKSLVRVSVASLIFAALLASACSRSQASNASKPHPSPVPTAANQTIGFLEERVREDPEDFIALNKLATEYLQIVRERGDVTYLDLAFRAANASLSVLPAEQNKGGLIALTQAEYSSHDFAKARDHALQLIALEPKKGYPYQMLGDALLELGQYEDAKIAFRQMEKFGGVQTITRAAIEQRLARLAMLRGNNDEAKRRYLRALKLLNAMPEPPREPVAWTEWQLGETAFAGRDYSVAEDYYRRSLASFPDYYRSLASLGRVLAARGDLTAAIQTYEKVVQILPDPVFLAALGDLYKLSGRDVEADSQYTLVEKIGSLNPVNGVLYNRQLALFLADHDIRVEDAYSNAAKEFEERRDIYGADALAWTAFKSGKSADAQAAIKAALRYGTQDARIFYHAGMIAKSAEQRKIAIGYLRKALRISPKFDPLQAVLATKALEELTTHDINPK